MSSLPLFHNLMGWLVGFDETGLAVFGGISVFVTMVALGRAFVPHDPMAARIKSHQQRRQHLLQQILTTEAPEGTAKQDYVQLIRKLVERLKLTRGDDARKTTDKLAQAGWRSRDMLAVYLGARFLMPFVAGAGALFVVT